MATMSTTERFSPEERAAMKERAEELKSGATGAAGEAEVLAKIAEMPDADRILAERFHALVRDVAPDLAPRTWYGMPAYARPGKNGKVLCFFQSAGKMKTRFSTIGFSDAAALDDGSMWATSFAVLEWNASNDKQLRSLVRNAVK